MPSEVTGNFYNATHPGEPVLGFFSGGSVREKRIFIGFYDLPDNLQVVPSRMFCEIDSIDIQDIHSYGNATLLIGSFGSPFPIGYTTSTSGCIDCRLQGGTTVKPIFWE
jgi:hypothetical protein